MSPSNIEPLIHTKLAPPRLGGLRLERDRLLDLLDARRDRSVTLIVGPTGSGKTTLAAMWRQRLISADIDVAWYNIGADDDEAQWATYLFAALQHAGLDVGPALAQALHQEATKSDDRFVALVANAVFAHRRPIVLVLDDLHTLRIRRPFELIDRLLLVLPTNLHLVITSRSPPPLTLDALRVKDQTTEISYEELRLSPDEQTRLFKELGVRRLSAGQMRRLYAVTEGWAAAAQLLGLSLKKDGDLDQAFARTTRATAQFEGEGPWTYLEEMLGAILTASQLDLLVRVSACRRFTRGLCEEICAEPSAGQALETLAAQNLLVLPVESNEPTAWFRLHPILSGYLRRRLTRLPAEELADLNRRACRWFESRCLLSDAIRHAHYAGDVSKMADLIASTARLMLYTGQYSQLLRRVAELPLQAWRSRMDVLLSVGWSQVATHRLREAEGTLEAIAEHPDATLPKVDVEVRLMRSFYAIVRDDTAAAMLLLRPLLDEAPQMDGFNLLMLASTGCAALVGTGEYERARDLAADCQLELRRERGARSRPFLESAPGLSLLTQGDFVQARDVLERTLRSLEREGDLAEFSSAFIAGYLAEVSYQLDDLDATEDYLDIYADAIEVMPDCCLYGLRARARLHFCKGDLSRALTALDELEQLAQDRGWDRLASWSLSERVRMLGREGSSITSMRETLRRLRRLAQRYSSSAAGTLGEIGLAVAIAEAEASAAERDWPRVLELAPSLAEKLKRKGRMFLAARLKVQAAMALLESRRTEEALQLARSVLLPAEHCGMRRLLVEDGEQMLKLVRTLRDIPDLRPEEQHLLDITISGSASAPQPTARAASPLAHENALTQKERETIQLLGRGLSIKTVARAQNVSPGTVKWRLKSVYRKLGAVSREDAIVKARGLGIIG